LCCYLAEESETILSDMGVLIVGHGADELEREQQKL
jgi:hypothetical protein